MQGDTEKMREKGIVPSKLEFFSYALISDVL